METVRQYDMKEMICEDVGWIHPGLAMDHTWAAVNTASSIWLP